MTSLKNKIIKNFIAGILACILVFSILVSFLLGRVSQNYIEKTQDLKPEQVKEDFQYLISQNNTELLAERLLEYSKNEHVNIELLDAKDTSILKVHGVEKDKSKALRTKNYRLISPTNDEYLGQLKVSYDLQEDAVDELRENFSNSVVVAIIISIAIGIVIALILSTNITRPIKSISDATLSIKDGNYDIDFKDSAINELENLQNNIKYLSINLKNQDTIRKQYAQDISHELRTPLTNLQLYIEAIKDKIIEADDDNLQAILDEVLRLKGLVVDLNKTFHDNSEYIDIHKEKFDLSYHLDLICKNITARAMAKNIKLTSHLEKSVFITSDKDKISQVMHNLLSNAIKAIGQDGHIDVSLTTNKNKIIIEVEDDGVGISEERLPMIFERFYRIDDARNTKENGHGLGLSISKNFIEALGGKISVESEIDKGTKFTIVFYK